MVQDVKRLGPKLISQLFSDNVAVLEKREVPIDDVRTPNIVSRGVPQGSWCREHKASGVEPLCHAPRAAVGVAAWHQVEAFAGIRIVPVETHTRDILSTIGDCVRSPALNGENATNFP